MKTKITLVLCSFFFVCIVQARSLETYVSADASSSNIVWGIENIPLDFSITDPPATGSGTIASSSFIVQEPEKEVQYDVKLLSTNKIITEDVVIEVTHRGLISSPHVACQIDYAIINIVAGNITSKSIPVTESVTRISISADELVPGINEIIVVVAYKPTRIRIAKYSY